MYILMISHLNKFNIFTHLKLILLLQMSKINDYTRRWSLSRASILGGLHVTIYRRHMIRLVEITISTNLKVRYIVTCTRTRGQLVFIIQFHHTTVSELLKRWRDDQLSSFWQEAEWRSRAWIHAFPVRSRWLELSAHVWKEMCLNNWTLA